MVIGEDLFDADEAGFDVAEALAEFPVGLGDLGRLHEVVGADVESPGDLGERLERGGVDALLPELVAARVHAQRLRPLQPGSGPPDAQVPEFACQVLGVIGPGLAHGRGTGFCHPRNIPLNPGKTYGRFILNGI